MVSGLYWKITTFGIGGKRVVSPASYPASSAPAFQRTGVGQLAAITSLCGAIPAGSPVLLLDHVAARRFTQVIRGMCGIPAGVMAGAAPAQVAEVIRQIMRTGPQAVLLGTRPGDAEPAGRPDDDPGRTRPDPAAGVGLARPLCALDVGAGHRGRVGGRGITGWRVARSRTPDCVICLRDVRALQ